MKMDIKMQFEKWNNAKMIMHMYLVFGENEIN
jgi:hypothetical protein